MEKLYWFLGVITALGVSLFAYFTFKHRQKGTTPALIAARHDFVETLTHPLQAWNELMTARETQLEYQGMLDPQATIQSQADEIARMK